MSGVNGNLPQHWESLYTPVSSGCVVLTSHVPNFPLLPLPGAMTCEGGIRSNVLPICPFKEIERALFPQEATWRAVMYSRWHRGQQLYIMIKAWGMPEHGIILHDNLWSYHKHTTSLSLYVSLFVLLSAHTCKALLSSPGQCNASGCGVDA